MPAINHHLILQGAETAILYIALVEARHKKVMEFDETHDMKVLVDIQVLRRLIEWVIRVMETEIALPSMN